MAFVPLWVSENSEEKGRAQALKSTEALPNMIYKSVENCEQV